MGPNFFDWKHTWLNASKSFASFLHTDMNGMHKLCDFGLVFFFTKSVLFQFTRFSEILSQKPCSSNDSKPFPFKRTTFNIQKIIVWAGICPERITGLHN